MFAAQVLALSLNIQILAAVKRLFSGKLKEVFTNKKRKNKEEIYRKSSWKLPKFQGNEKNVDSLVQVFYNIT